ncbi:hypothetical protein [Catonella massiliensis]|uniref:Uncharacterized protein n=1 Tax=Catonella massiliensis TaxID=2799636 RepID=A0ABS1IZ10_9FIRM|nr:hypothetical protein [Catonella massiliensis]MBK5897125.1 hypothetical protein [Catonella massiliensis]
MRALRPFSDLKDPTNTIYDHLPYRKDINLIKESDIRMVSGNVVKYTQLVVEEAKIIDTNELAEIIIEEANSLYEAQLSEREPDETLMDDVSEDEIVAAADDDDDVDDDELFTGELDMDSINALAEADENEDDYSFLNDE